MTPLVRQIQPRQNRSGTVVGGVVEIVLVQVQSFGKDLKKAQKEFTGVMAANKGLRGAAGRLLAANKLLEAEATTTPKGQLRLGAEQAKVEHQ